LNEEHVVEMPVWAEYRLVGEAGDGSSYAVIWLSSGPEPGIPEISGCIA
jgi:hypothetical protein